ncbi:MAG: acyltransferase [Anaerolineae bacterium]|nr:acyltransferase [Gloeobacterales cyanobacterium ES-bin-313]
MNSILSFSKLLNASISRFEKSSNKIRILKLKSLGINLDYTCILNKNVIAELGFSHTKKGIITLSSNTKLKYGVVLNAWGGSIEIKSNVFIGEYTVIYGHGGVSIGKDSLIAMHCKILSSNHTVPDRESQICSKPDILLPTTIGEDVWLGAGVTVLGGVKIGDGCVVGAGAVVSTSLPPYSVAVGVPARIVRMRE